MSIDSQLLNLTGGIKTSGHIKSNFGATIGVGTDAPTGIVEVQHSQPTLVVQQQATSGGSVTSYGKVHATSGTLHIQSGIDATSDSKGDIVLGSVGSGTKHVVVKGATSRVGIGTDAPAYGLDVTPESRFTGNVTASNISANAITLNELSLGVTQGLDNIVNVDNTTSNTIAMSNVDASTSTTTGALTVAGGIGVGGNVHCSNLYASNITMNLVSFTGLQTFEQVVNNGRVLDSNVLIISNATPSTSSTTGALTLTGGGLGVAGNVVVGSSSLYVDTLNSRVGVGAPNPQYKLDVDGGTTEGAGDVMLRMMGAHAQTGKLIFGRTGTTDMRSHAIECYNTAGGENNYMKFLVHDGGSSSPYETRTEVMTLRGDGNVEVGTNVGSLSGKLVVSLDSQTGSSDTRGLVIQNFSNGYSDVTNGFGSSILFRTNRGTSAVYATDSAAIKGYIYAGAGGTMDYHALDLDVYGDNASLNKGMSILAMSHTGGPANTRIHGNVGIRTDPNVNSRLHIDHNEEQNSTDNQYVSYLQSTVTGSTALTAYRYYSGNKVELQTQFSGSSIASRHTVKGFESYVYSSGTANPHYMYGIETQCRSYSTGAISYIVGGGRFLGKQDSGSSQPIQSIVGTMSTAIKDGTGAATYLYGGIHNVTASSGTVTNQYGVTSGMTNSGASITNSYQLKASTNQSSGSITNNWGLYLTSQLALNHYMEAETVKWRSPYYTSQRHLHLNETTAQYNQTLNYTQYANKSAGPTYTHDSSMGLWMGNFTDENWSGQGRNFIAWTATLQLYRTSDLTGYQDSLSFTSNTSDLKHDGTAFDKVGFFDTSSSNSDLNNFTGQHRCLVEEVRHDQAEDHAGLIVCANKNEYFKMSGGTDFTFTVNEALPLVSLSKKAMDKSCFGVISSSEDPEERVDRYGTFTAQFEKERGDTRIYINSVGEGGIWVINANGNLESGDYITTSDVAGYGMRQDDDILHNYTVAKITCDCDFNPMDKPVKQIVRTREDYDVWYAFQNITFAEYSNTAPNKTHTFDETYYTIQQLQEVSTSNETIDVTLCIEKEGDAKISVDVWNDLSREEQAKYEKKDFKYIDVEVSVDEHPDATMHTTRYQKIVDRTDELPKHEKEASKFTYKRVEQRWVNVLDEHGQLQWEDHPTETEKAYKIRYLTADGTQTDEANAVHVAAFVGCTYHCG